MALAAITVLVIQGGIAAGASTLRDILDLRTVLAITAVVASCSSASPCDSSTSSRSGSPASCPPSSSHRSSFASATSCEPPWADPLAFGLHPRRCMSTPLEIRRGQPIGQPMGDAFVLPYQRTRLILMTVLSIAFAVVEIILVIVGDGGERIGGALAVLFFGGGAVAPARWSPSPTIALTRHGLAADPAGRAVLPWSALTAVGERWIGRTAWSSSTSTTRRAS